MTNQLVDALFSDYYLEGWQMSFDQRFALIGVLSQIKPEISIEIGTFRAGSLSAIARFSQQVYSIDIDSEIPARYGQRFPNVTFEIGRSADVLPELLAHIRSGDRNLGFVLIDGDHSTEGVRQDCNLILTYEPRQPLYVMMHDTFNPAVRQGILSADWQKNPYVHEVHLDFVPGTFRDHKGRSDYRELWGGLGLAILLPEQRAGDLRLITRCDYAHDVLLRHSTHYRQLSGINRLLAGFRRYWYKRHRRR